MATLRLDDEPTITAIGILADVLDRFSGKASLECALVSKALRQVQATRSQVGMEFASRAFATLDPTMRQQIAGEAEGAAQEFLDTRLPRLRAPRPAAPAEKPQATGLLNALNAGGRRPSRQV
jgi:hypothetical protein